MSNAAIKIEVSEGAVKAMAVGAVVLGFVWLIWKLSEDKPEEHLPIEAEEFSHLKAVTPSRLDEVQYDVGIVEHVSALFGAGHYAQAVEEACKRLYKTIREVSGYNEKDGTRLIDIVFREKKILQFKDVTEAHIRGVEDGYTEGMRYLSKSVRNLIAHSTIQITEVDALTSINLACFLAYQVEHNTIRILDAPKEDA